jgi:hypothetical protein
MTNKQLSNGEPAARPAENTDRVALTYSEFGKRVGLSAATIRRLCKTGDIEVRIFNKRLARIPVSELQLFA